MGDTDGWRRGAKGIDGVGNPGLRRGEDYRNGEIRSANAEPSNGGYSGPMPRGGAARYKPKSPGSLKPVSAASPTGKYGRK